MEVIYIRGGSLDWLVWYSLFHTREHWEPSSYLVAGTESLSSTNGFEGLVFSLHWKSEGAGFWHQWENARATVAGTEETALSPKVKASRLLASLLTASFLLPLLYLGCHRKVSPADIEGEISQTTWSRKFLTVMPSGFTFELTAEPVNSTARSKHYSGQQQWRKLVICWSKIFPIMLWGIFIKNEGPGKRMGWSLCPPSMLVVVSWKNPKWP